MINQVTAKERDVLRTLAQQYADIAHLDVHKEKIELWKALNRGKMQRPMVLIDQLPWNELNINNELTLQVEHPFFQSVEKEMRRTIYKWRHMPADMVVEPFITIPKLITNTKYGLQAEADKRVTDQDNSVVSREFHNQLNEPEDVAKIKDMCITYDEAGTLALLDMASDIFAGILPVKLGGMTFHLGVWDQLSMYMSVEAIYYELADRPEFLHMLVDRMYQSLLKGIQTANDLQLHDDLANLCHCSHIYTDELLPAPGQGKGPTSENCWAFGLAQLFTSASPSVTQELELDYLKKVAPLFGMLYYGCCERLDDRIERILQIPNIRKISCSPWSKKEAFAEKIGPSVVISNKPNPSFIASEPSQDIIRGDLQETCDIAKKHGANLELILKDISTVQYHPERIFNWEKTAMQIVQSF